ncbi:hypothetical protein [Desulfocurvus sp. DL9XJH121]
MRWEFSAVAMVGWILTVVWMAAGINRDVQANTEFRKAAAPRIERMDTTLQRVDRNVERLLGEARNH